VTRDPSRDETELHAAADGQLDRARRDAMTARLAADPEAAARVDFYRRLNQALHGLYDPLLDEPVPGIPSRPRPIGPPLARVAAALVLLLAGAAGGWLARDRLGGEAPIMAGIDLPLLAASAHQIYTTEVRHPVEVGADEEEHLVRWLSKRLGAEVRAPNLNRFDYRLVGGRLLPAGEGVAGQFMYEKPDGARLTLFLASGRDSDESAFRFKEEGGVSVFYWRDGGFGYALSAALSREALLPLCNEVYAQLNPDEPPPSW
jgi:anti-sigma factor RsiW